LEYSSYIELLVKLGFDMSKNEYVEFFQDKDNNLTAIKKFDKSGFKNKIDNMLNGQVLNHRTYKAKCLAFYDFPQSKIFKIDIDCNKRIIKDILEQLEKIFETKPLFILDSIFDKGYHLYYKVENSMSDGFKAKLINKVNEKVKGFKIDKSCSTIQALRPIGIQDYTIYDSNMNIIKIENTISHIDQFDFEIENNLLKNIVYPKVEKSENEEIEN